MEAALIGLFRRGAGSLGGLLFAKGIESLFNALGIGLRPPRSWSRPDGDRLGRLGVAVTLIAVLNPALR